MSQVGTGAPGLDLSAQPVGAAGRLPLWCLLPETQGAPPALWFPGSGPLLSITYSGALPTLPVSFRGMLSMQKVMGGGGIPEEKLLEAPAP